MLTRIAVIALNTFREAARARVIYGLVGVAIATTFYSIVVGAYTLKSAPRVVADLGSSSINLYAVVVAIVLSASSLYRELEQKTLFPILARPVRRSEYLVGKYLGTLCTLGTFVAIDGFVVLFTLAVMGGRSPLIVFGIGAVALAALVVAGFRAGRIATYAVIPWALVLLVVAALLASGLQDERRVVLGMCALTLLEVSIVTAVATLFASFSSPFLTAVLTLGVFVVGRQADTLAKLPVKMFGRTVHDAGVVLAKLVPNLHVYVPARPLLTGEALDAAFGRYLGLASLQALGWTALLLGVAALIFRRRDFL
jgi:ABC-type transport system involved in multi-copper enzyme maturation permease subunit